MEKIISKNLITAIPGIGSKYAQRLNAIGIKNVSIFGNQTKENRTIPFIDEQKMNAQVLFFIYSPVIY